MTKDCKASPSPNRPFFHGIDLLMWTFLGRSIFAVALGLSLIFIPERTNFLVANLIAGFWVGTGVLTIRWGIADHRSRILTLVTGTAAIVAGSLAYARHLLQYYVPEHSILLVLGLVSILTGVLHLSGQIPASRIHYRSTARSRVPLGTFEIGLGVVILLQGRGPLTYEAMAAWALIGGLILLSDGLYLAREDRLTRAEKMSSSSTDEPDVPSA